MTIPVAVAFVIALVLAALFVIGYLSLIERQKNKRD